MDFPRAMICPKCGSNMAIRTARRGRYAGRQFYGCTNYRCRHIIDIGDADRFGRDEDNGSELSDYRTDGYASEPIQIEIPTFLRARERFRDYQVRFYETMAVPVEFLDQINLGSVGKERLNSLNQWRLDYPIGPDILFDERMQQVLRVVYKILTRGRITLLSPFLEHQYREYFRPAGFDSNSLDLSCYYSLTDTSHESDVWFDGQGTERIFYQDIMPDVLGPYYRKFIIPQIHLSSLARTDDTMEQQRVDFAIITPNKRIVVELDDESHEAHSSRDDSRDNLLTSAGFDVIRIKNREIDGRSGPNLQRLYDLLKSDKTSPIGDLSDTDKYMLSVKLAHQLQIVIVEAILSGFIDLKKAAGIYFDGEFAPFTEDELTFILESSGNDLSELIEKTSILYSLDVEMKGFSLSLFRPGIQQDGVVISYNENLSSEMPRFIMQDISFPNVIAQDYRPAGPAVISAPEEPILTYFLRYIFRHDQFMEGQFEAISRALAGKDAIVLLPTGGGKSVAFQLASMLLSGVTIVVDPIIALIEDQIDNLKRSGIDRAVGITSQITDPETRSRVIRSFGQGEYVFCYVAPERFQTQQFRTAIETLRQFTPISLIAIDEAHCVSEWGHDFRTSYLNIGRVTRDYCASGGRVPPLLALTGTASSSVLRDVKRELQISDFDAVITPATFDRAEIRFSVLGSSSDDKSSVLMGLLQRYLPEQFRMSSSSFYQPHGKNTKCGIIFCPHVGGSFGVVEIARKVSGELGVQTHIYAGRIPKGWNDWRWNTYKRQVARDYKNNSFPLLVATKSFGMGIDKPNIRYTIHFGIPNSIEAFYQEAGRAGRDRDHAVAVVLVSNDNQDRASRLLNPNASSEDIAGILERERNWETDDDITRAMWFHSQAFRGVRNEVEDIGEIIRDIGDLSRMRRINLAFPRNRRNQIEKGLHRLVILGVVADYTIDYSANEFHVALGGIDSEAVIENYAQYVSGYNRGRVRSEIARMEQYSHLGFSEFVLRASGALINFVYSTIEKGRRRALREMLSLAEASVAVGSDADTVVRDRILRYLESTYSEELDEILNEKDGFGKLRVMVEGYEDPETGEMIGGIRAPKDASEIRGQVARYLESTPDHPGLLFLRAMSEMYCSDFDVDIVVQNIMAGLNSAFDEYSIRKTEIYNTLTWMVIQVYSSRKSIYFEIAPVMLYTIVDDPEFAEAMLHNENIDEEMIYEPGVYLFSRISRQAVDIFR